MWQLAAIMAPYVLGEMQDKPDQPRMKKVSVAPARDAYYRSMVDTAFNPNSREFLMASEHVQDQVSRALARQGLSGSSIGLQSMAGAQSSMAADFMRAHQAERMAAVNAMVGHDMEKFKLNQMAAEQNYNRDLQAYNEALRRQAGVAQGIGSVIGSFAQNQQRQDDRSWYADMIQKQNAGPVAPVVPQQMGFASAGLPYSTQPAYTQPAYFGYAPYGGYQQVSGF